MATSRDLQATVLVPTHDHGALLRYSVGSALRQSIGDIEVLIVGDGMPDQARAIALELEAADERVRVFDNPKGESKGELHRHAALGEARGRLVFYLSDDDLWFPEHVESITATFEATGAQFVHAPPVGRFGDGGYYRSIVDLAQEPYRQAMYEHANRVPLSCGAHTPAAYRSLPEGWRITPPGEWSDAWMWRQFADQPGMKFACSDRPTVLNFPSRGRESWTADQRLEELADHTEMLDDPRRRLELLMELFKSDQERLAWFETHIWDLDDWLEDRINALVLHLGRAAALEQVIVQMQQSRRWRAGERVAQARRRFSRP